MSGKTEKRITRRRFLGGMAGCGAAMSILGKCAGSVTSKPAVKKQWKMKMSAASVCYSSLPIEQACERIGALGFDGIDIWPTIFHCKHLEEVRTRLGAVGLKKLLKKHKLEISAFSVYGGGNGFKKYAELIGKAGGGVRRMPSSSEKPPAEPRRNCR